MVSLVYCHLPAGLSDFTLDFLACLRGNSGVVDGGLIVDYADAVVAKRRGIFNIQKRIIQK